MQNNLIILYFYTHSSMDKHHISKFTFILIIGLLSACDLKNPFSQEKVAENTTEAPKKEAEVATTTKSNYKSATISKKSTSCKTNNCTRVNVNYPKFPEEEKLNKAINSEISAMLADYVMGAKATDTPENIAEMYVASYEDFKKEFPETQNPWYIEMEGQITYQSKEFTSIKFVTESYGGGAHSNEETKYVNISSKGKILDRVSFFIRDKPGMLRLAESQFRKDNNLDENQSLAAAGFNFDDGKFSLSQNFGFNKKGIVFYYNNYEIVSDSEGGFELIIPFEIFKEMFRIE
jgi:hypothetical protein